MRATRRGKRMLVCGRHGRRPWRFDIVCEHCGARWQLRSANEPLFAPTFCTCGKRLVPERVGADHSTYTGAPICVDCARFAGSA